jgi:hypothetical protein
MKSQFFDGPICYQFEFVKFNSSIFPFTECEGVDIIQFTPGFSGGRAWFHLIKNNKIIWRHDNFVSPAAMEHISNILRFKAFI